MEQEIRIPPLGESVSEVSIGRWLKASHAHVLENDEIVELETEKLNQVLYAPVSGTLITKVGEGEKVQIGDLIAVIEPSEKAAPAPAVKEEKKPEPARVKPSEEPPVIQENVRESRRKMTRIRKAIAERLVESLRSSAMLTTFNEVDMSAIIDLRAEQKTSFVEKHGVKLGFMSFFVKAVVEGLKAFPDFNSYIEGDEIVHREYYDVAIAVGGAKGGLVVPVVRECDRLSYAEIEKQIAELALKAREGRLTVDEIQGGGFTITNGGVYGSLLSTPLLNAPQVGILGMHNIEKRVVVIDDKIVIRPMMYLALSYDHRLIDGKDAILFLVKIKEYLEKPSFIVDSA